MRDRFDRGVFILALITLACGAAFGQDSKPQQQGKPTRVVAKGSWQVLRNIGLDDDLFDDPALMVADSTRVVVFDYGTNSVKSVALDGALEWAVGRKGRGPGEYINPLSLSLANEGHVIINDPETGRITEIDRKGKIVRVVPVAKRFEFALPARRPEAYLLLNSTSDSLAMLADSSGNLTAAASMPSDMRTAGAITREFTGAASSSSGQVVAFRWSSRMLLLGARGEMVRSCMGVDSLSFPPMRQTQLMLQKTKARVSRVDPRAREAAGSITRLGSYTAVLRPPITSDSGRMIDLYASDCGRYMESRRLPIKPARIAGSREDLIGLVMDPVPHLVTLRWIPSNK